MASPATEFTIKALVSGLEQVEGLKSAVRSLQNTAQPAAADINKLRDAAKSLGNASEASTSDLRTSVTVLKSLKDQVALTSKEYRDLSNDLKTVENRFNAANTAAKQFRSSAGPITGGKEGLQGMGRPAEKLEPAPRLGFQTNDVEYWRRKQQNIGGPQLGPQQLDYEATTKGLTGLESALDQMNNITNRKRQEKLQIQEKYNQLEIEQQDAAFKKQQAKHQQQADIAGRDFLDRVNNAASIREKAEQRIAQRRQRLATAGQTVGAVAAAGVFGGPEGALGATIGAFGGPGGALVGGAIGAQVGMLRQSIGDTATYSSEITKLNIALKGVTKTSDEYAAAQNAISSISTSLNVPIKEATAGFTKLSASVIGAGGNVNDAQIVMRGFTQAIKATGGGAEQVAGAMTALTQIFSKGKVSAEEINQIAERLPGAFTAIAKASGKTGPELQKALENGEVGLNDLMKTAQYLTDQYGASAAKMAASTEESGARMTIALDKVKFKVGQAFQPIGSEFQDSITNLTNATIFALEALYEQNEKIRTQISSVFGKNSQKTFTDYFDRFNLNIAATVLNIGPLVNALKQIEKFLPKQKTGQQKLIEAGSTTMYTDESGNVYDTATGRLISKAPSNFPKGTDEADRAKAIADIKQKAIIQLRELAERTEEQVADIREAAIKRSIELERNFADQRLKTEREIQDLRNRSNELDKNIGFNKEREELRSLGLGTEGVDAAEKVSGIFQNAQKERLQLQRNAEDNNLQRERQLEQFKITNAEQIGKIQLTYTRSTADILQKVGDALKEKMITGAEEVKRIILEVRTGQQAPAYPTLPDPNIHLRPTKQRADSSEAGVGRIITPAETRPKGQSDFRGQSDVMTHYTEKVPKGQGMLTRKQFLEQMGPPEKAAKKLEQSQSTAKEIAGNNVLKNVLDKLGEARQEALKPLNDQKKSLIDQISTQQRLYDLISSGLNPALADQVLSIEKAAENQDKVLTSVRDRAIIESKIMENSEKDRSAALALSEQLQTDLTTQLSSTQALKEQAIALEKAAEATTRLVNEKQRMKDLVQGINSSIESGMVSAIDSAITGAKSLQEVMSNVLKDIGQMLISFGVKSLLSSLTGPSSSILSGGGFSAGTSTAFGGGIPGLDMAQFGGIKMFAAGGTPPVGKASLVGEKGPELFVPRTSGTIFPADATAAAMARYQRQGGSSGGNSSSDAMGAGAAATPVLSMSFETTRFLGQDYVSTDQLQAAMMATEKRAASAGAKAGAAQVSSQMRNSPAYRRQVGLR